MAKERRCICCNKAYKYCGQCKEYSNLPAWMNEFCSEECKELFNIMSVYNMGYADKSQIENVIKKYNITDYSKYKSSTANKLNELFSSTTIDLVVDEKPAEESVSVEESQPIIEETVFSENITVEEPDQIEEVKPVEEKYNSQRNRRLRRKNYEKTANTEE